MNDSDVAVWINCLAGSYIKIHIYIIIRHCSGVGAFPRPSGRGLGHSLVPIPITARVIRRFQKNICRSTRTDLASFSLSDRRAAPHSRVHQYRLMAVSAVIQSAARLERGRTLNNVRGREGGREGEGGEGRAGEGRGLSTLSTNQNLCDRGA